ncbi:hypothetical protein GVX82_00160 [Patescibacteria group bacterium]|jgi:uncharacterized protein with PQ loop repeat|nr:hypothetical protein [Patescibacteria group bacterium]
MVVPNSEWAGVFALVTEHFIDLNGQTFAEWMVNISIILLIIFKFFSLYGQARGITDGSGIALFWFTYFVADYFAGFVYGFFSHGFVVMMGGLVLGVGHYLVLRRLRRVCALTVFERGLQLLVWVVPLIMLLACVADQVLGLTDWTLRQLVFTVSAAIVLFAFATQPCKLRRERQRGDLQLQTLLFILVENTLWLTYSIFIFQQLEFIFFAAAAEGLILWTIFEWWRSVPRASTTDGSGSS